MTLKDFSTAVFWAGLVVNVALALLMVSSFLGGGPIPWVMLVELGEWTGEMWWLGPTADFAIMVTSAALAYREGPPRRLEIY